LIQEKIQEKYEDIKNRLPIKKADETEEVQENSEHGENEEHEEM
jgi:hypothetical protein